MTTNDDALDAARFRFILDHCSLNAGHGSYPAGRYPTLTLHFSAEIASSFDRSDKTEPMHRSWRGQGIETKIDDMIAESASLPAHSTILPTTSLKIPMPPCAPNRGSEPTMPPEGFVITGFGSAAQKIPNNQGTGIYVDKHGNETPARSSYDDQVLTRGIVDLGQRVADLENRRSGMSDDERALLKMLAYAVVKSHLGGVQDETAALLERIKH